MYIQNCVVISEAREEGGEGQIIIYNIHSVSTAFLATSNLPYEFILPLINMNDRNLDQFHFFICIDLRLP